MSELIHTNCNRTSIRLKLLAGASALALTAHVSAVHAESSDRPQVWIEVGGEFGRLQDAHEVFAPSLMNERPSFFDPSQNFEKPPASSIDVDGKISLQPENSSWTFSASISYGRATSKKHVTQQTSNSYSFSKYPGDPTYVSQYARKFSETISRNTEQHAILDFQAGKDVGLGIFGKDSSAMLSLGVRIAQFTSASSSVLRSDPDWTLSTKYYFGFKIPVQNYHSNAASFSAQRSFRGIGPSLSWNASAPLLGHSEDGEVTFDWGVDGAILFGKQKTRTHHQTTGRYHYWTNYHGSQSRRPITYQGPAVPDHVRSKSVAVPNVGGFAGVSLRYPNAKVSLGYRADFFFGAMDGGIDARRTEDVGFHGPFATISIGLGG